MAVADGAVTAGGTLAVDEALSGDNVEEDSGGGAVGSDEDRDFCAAASADEHDLVP